MNQKKTFQIGDSQIAKPKKLKQIEFREYLWTTANVEIEDFCNQLSRALQLPAFEHSAENVWEYSISHIKEIDIEVNISRKHDRGVPLFDEPFMIVLIAWEGREQKYNREWVKNNLVPKLSQTIADLLDESVYYGRVEYLGGSDFEFLPTVTYIQKIQK